MKYSLRLKLSVSYVLVALISVFLISIFANVFLERQFMEYIKKNQAQKNKEVVTSIAQQFMENKKWNLEGIETIGVSALENGMIIKVENSSGKIIWDATVHNNGMCQRIIQHMSQNLNSRYPNMKVKYIEKPYPVYSGLNKVGTVEIGSYGPFYLSDSDLSFINTLNTMIIGIGLFSLLFALILGGIMAKRLSSPISRVIESALLISKGYFSDRITQKSNTKEICQLTATVNDLADTLEKQEIHRKRITADVAHELRTPLATLQSHIEAMIDGIWQPDTERLKSCHEEIIRLAKMVGDLEELARYESENLLLNKSKFDISELLKHIIMNYENEFMNKGLHIAFFGEKKIIEGDKDKISQVFINLMSNALKYTQIGGNVTVYVKGAEDIVQVSVKDNGQGIGREDLDHIFERFYRADKSRNRLTGGSGIGLTIVKAIIEAHNGNIEVQSTIGVGTEFIVSLPIGYL